MLGSTGSCGFCPAGRCPSLNSSLHAKDLNHSISPIDTKSEENKDKEIEDNEMEEGVEVEEEKHEGEVVQPPERDCEEMRRPRLQGFLFYR